MNQKTKIIVVEKNTNTGNVYSNSFQNMFISGFHLFLLGGSGDGLLPQFLLGGFPLVEFLNPLLQFRIGLLDLINLSLLRLVLHGFAGSQYLGDRCLSLCSFKTGN